MQSSMLILKNPTTHLTTQLLSVTSTVSSGKRPLSNKVTTTYHHIQNGKLIQPFGCSLALDEKTFKVIVYSENAPEMLTIFSSLWR